jgi:spermidine synthase
LKALGKQIFIDLYHCNTALINDVEYIKKTMEAAAQKAHATIINSTFHHFSPHGVSGVVVIQESHLAIHTWPEHGFSAIDIFTCGETIDAQAAYEYLKSALEATHSTASEMQRGLYPRSAGE